MENYSHANRGNGGIVSLGTRALAILGFLAILSVGLWGSVTVASAVPNAFQAIASALSSLTSIFVSANETISLSAPSLSVASNEAFALSWTHADKNVNGSYTFRYDCADGVYFTSPDATNAQAVVYCNVPFNFLHTENSISLTPVSKNNRFIDVQVYVDFTPNGASVATVTGSTVMTIVNESLTTSPVLTGSGTPTAVVPATPETPTAPVASLPTTPTAGTPTSNVYLIDGSIPQGSDPNGSVDLVPRIIETGTVNITTGVFTQSDTPLRNPVGARVAVRFAVENKGTKRSPPFDFAAVLPTLPQNIFQSPMQAELNPGDRIEFTLAFDRFVEADSGEITINIDPSHRFNESNKENNILKYTVSVVR